MSRLIIVGILALVLVLSALGLTFAQPLPNCHKIDAVLATMHLNGTKFLVVSGWRGAMLAQIHRREAPARYELEHPVSTVLLSRADDGSVLLGIQVGAEFCAPLRFDRASWARVVTRLWGRGA